MRKLEPGTRVKVRQAERGGPHGFGSVVESTDGGYVVNLSIEEPESEGGRTIARTERVEVKTKDVTEAPE